MLIFSTIILIGATPNIAPKIIASSPFPTASRLPGSSQLNISPSSIINVHNKQAPRLVPKKTLTMSQLISSAGALSNLKIASPGSIIRPNSTNVMIRPNTTTVSIRPNLNSSNLSIRPNLNATNVSLPQGLNSSNGVSFITIPKGQVNLSNQSLFANKTVINPTKSAVQTTKISTVLLQKGPQLAGNGFA